MKVFKAILRGLGPQPPAEPVRDRAQVERLYRHWRLRVMYSMVAGYACYYFLRNNLPMTAKAITDEHRFSNTQWGLVISSSTIVYAASKFLSGVVGDRANPRFLLSLGLLASAIVNLFFGFASSLGFFVALWSLNNLFQGAGVPPCVRLMTYWYSPKEIGRAWGIWNSSHQIGGAIIAVAAGYLVAHFGWRSAFWVPAVLCVGVSFWLMNRLTDSPEALGLPAVEVHKEGTAAGTVADVNAPFFGVFKKHILRNKWVWIVSIANFFVYFVRIGVLQWAPKFLIEAKGFTLTASGWSLSAFEVAGIFGAYSSGWLSDTVFKGRRGPISTVFMLILIGGVFALFYVPKGHVATMTALFALLGFLVYGPQMLIAVAATDFATKAAASSAVGLTGLFGYIAASACGLGTGMVVDRYGWNGAVWLYTGSAAVGCALLATTWSKRA